MNAGLEARLEALRPAVLRRAPFEWEGKARFVLFLSFTDGRDRARVVSATGASAAEAWAAASAEARQAGMEARWVRADWIEQAERSDWRTLRAHLARIKRNYFRLGISLDPDFRHAFLETELNANAMLYGGPREPCATLNEGNFRRYAGRRHGLSRLDFADEAPVWLFSTRGAFAGDDVQPVLDLEGAGLDAGRRRIARLTPDDLFGLIDRGSRYLARQVKPDGRFVYGWHPCFDREIRSYNSLRHASTLYAMLEAWEVTHDAGLGEAIDRALDCLTRELIRPATLPPGEAAAFLVDTGDEVKLGGNAVALLALAKHEELTGSGAHRALMDALGAGILHMQDAGGRFDHVLHWPSLAVKAPFRIIYYDGEAAFALMRLYRLTGDPRWIEAVERAFGHFIAAGHQSANDHWLGYCVNELTQHRPHEAYFRFGLDNVRDHLDFVLERITTFPTLLELMMAAQKMIARLIADPALRHLLDGFDLAKFDRALHHRAHYLLNGHFWPELAMFFAAPERIEGSFFIRHHAFRVRIDDVEHYLSGLIAYRNHLLEREAARPPAPRWTAAEVAAAAGGTWVSAPPPGWQAAGVSIFAPTFRPGEMAVARAAAGGAGMAAAQLAKLAAPPAALITDAPEAFRDAGIPVLAVPDNDEAVLALGRHARGALSAKVIGVTGSAGKTTTVAMLAQALAPFGPVEQTRGNANLPRGIAWNLASFDRAARHAVLEMAIGRMARNTELARPDVAVFTNILPAHLQYHRDTATIARRKSAIFRGMAPGGIAVLNRDMDQWPLVHGAARKQGLEVLTYGRSPACAVRLLGYDPATRTVDASILGKPVRYRLEARGEHMALNSLAALAAVGALGLDLERAVERLAAFRPVDGRGNELAVALDGRRITIINDSYNANPGSMEAALAVLEASRGPRRVAVLGEMLELGEQAAAYHARLAPAINGGAIDRVHVAGALFTSFWAALDGAKRGIFAASLDELKTRLLPDLEDGDAVLLKGSHGSGLHALVPWLLDHQRGGRAGAGQERNRQ